MEFFSLESKRLLQPQEEDSKSRTEKPRLTAINLTYLTYYWRGTEQMFQCMNQSFIIDETGDPVSFNITELTK